LITASVKPHVFAINLLKESFSLQIHVIPKSIPTPIVPTIPNRASFNKESTIIIQFSGIFSIANIFLSCGLVLACSGVQ
jgi:hypothetical protein